MRVIGFLQESFYLYLYNKAVNVPALADNLKKKLFLFLLQFLRKKFVLSNKCVKFNDLMTQAKIKVFFRKMNRLPFEENSVNELSETSKMLNPLKRPRNYK